MGAVLAIAGAALQALGQQKEAKAAEKAAEHQEAVDRNNALIGEQRIISLKEQGTRDIAGLERSAIQRIGDNITQFADSGIDVSSQVVGKSIEDVTIITGADIVEYEHNQKLDAWNIKLGIQSDLANAQLAKIRARSAKEAGVISAAGSAATIAGSRGRAGAKAAASGGNE